MQAQAGGDGGLEQMASAELARVTGLQMYFEGTAGRCVKKASEGTSPVAQWLRICLPMQGTRVQALVREDPTCRRATKPVSHNY